MLPLKPTRESGAARFDVSTTALPFRVAATADVGTVARIDVRTTPAVGDVCTLGPRRSRAATNLGDAMPAMAVKRPCEPPSLPEVASVSDRRSITPPPESPLTAKPRDEAAGGRTCLRISGLPVLAGAVSWMIRLGLAAAARTAW